MANFASKWPFFLTFCSALESERSFWKPLELLPCVEYCFLVMVYLQQFSCNGVLAMTPFIPTLTITSSQMRYHIKEACKFEINGETRLKILYKFAKLLVNYSAC